MPLDFTDNMTEADFAHIPEGNSHIYYMAGNNIMASKKVFPSDHDRALYARFLGKIEDLDEEISPISKQEYFSMKFGAHFGTVMYRYELRNEMGGLISTVNSFLQFASFQVNSLKDYFIKHRGVDADEAESAVAYIDGYLMRE